MLWGLFFQADMKQVSASSHPSSQWADRSLSLGIVAVLLWSTVAVAFKWALASATLPQLLSGATLTSTVVLGLALATQGKLSDALRSVKLHFIPSCRLALLNPLLYYSLLFGAYQRLPAHLAQALNYTWPIALSLGGRIVLKTQLRRVELAGIFLCYLGVLVLYPRDMTGPDGLLGFALALGSALVWATSWLLAARDRRPPEYALFHQFLLATPVAVIALLGLQGPPQSLDMRAIFGAIYIGLFEMGLTFLIWQKALRTTRHLARLSALSYLSPLLSLGWIHLVLDEPLGPHFVLGGALVVGGAMIQQGRRRSHSLDGPGAGT